MLYTASGMCEIKFTYNGSNIGTQSYSATASNEMYNVAVDKLIENLNILVDKFFVVNPSYILENVIYTNINCLLTTLPNDSEDISYIEYPITNEYANVAGVYITVNFKNGNVLTSPVFNYLLDAVNYINYILDKLVINISKLLVKSLTIFINPGDCYVTKENALINNNEFSAAGVYNSCSDTPILDLYIGNEKVIINNFSIGGAGATNIYGSCRFLIYNFCSLPNNTYDENREIVILPKIVFQSFIWTGSLWVDFIYNNLPEQLITTSYNANGMRQYTNSNELVFNPNSTGANSTAAKYPWLFENAGDEFIMTNVIIQIPHSTNVPFNSNIYRIKPLFYFNSFKILQCQLSSCNIYSFASPNLTGNPPPLVLLNTAFTGSFLNTEWLMTNTKFSGETFGNYIPICLAIDNSQKVGILSSSLSGQIVIKANSLAIANSYLLALGTLNGQPLTEDNPISKAIIYNCYNTANGISSRPGGAVAPSRFVLNGNEIVASTFKPLSKELYINPTEATQYLPWTLENLENNPPPISKFSSSLYWNVSNIVIGASFTISSYGALLLTNYDTVKIPL